MKSLAKAIALTIALALTACGSSSETKVETATTGQQLIDLQAAYQNGTISAGEYESKRREILRE